MSTLTSITPEQKKRRFRALTREENIRIGSQYEQEFRQLFLPFNEFSQENRADAFPRLTRRALEVGGKKL
jgi:hypothetical protein